jgi:serine protease Do
VLSLSAQTNVVPSARASAPDSTIELANLQNQFEAVADRIAPSVVAISATVTGPDSDDTVRADSMNGEKLASILEKTTRTVGTGFVVDSAGYILTNEHVIADSGPIWITTDKGRVLPAVVIGSDPRADLAVLKVADTTLPAVKFAMVDTVHRGMWAIALGNPYGLSGIGEMCMSVGIVSATDRSLPKLASQENRYYADLIQTTAEINPGNSGGPLFNIAGEVIGISTAVILPQKATNGIGFAMPITPETLKRVQDLKDGREVVYAYLGVMVATPTDRQRRAAGITDASGVWVDSIENDSPAANVLKPDDIVIKLDDAVMNDSDQFIRAIGQSSVSKPVKMVVRRDGRPLTLAVQLRRRELPSVAISRDNQRMRWRGMLLGPIPANWDFAPSKRPEHGLMVLGVDPAGPMAKEGIRSGAVITSIAGKAIDAIPDLQSLLAATPAEQCSLEFAPAAPLAREAVVSGQ